MVWRERRIHLFANDLRMTCMRQLIRGAMLKMFLSYFYESHRTAGIQSPGSTGNKAGKHCPWAWWYLELGGRHRLKCAFGTVTDGITALQATFSQSLVETDLDSTTGWQHSCKPWPTLGKCWSRYTVQKLLKAPTVWHMGARTSALSFPGSFKWLQAV